MSLKDTMAERDYLIEHVFPKLKEYCKKSHDLDFQVSKILLHARSIKIISARTKLKTVDMRWGVPSDASEYHGTTQLCLNEIKNCKMYSIGPNFIVRVNLQSKE